MILEGHIFGIPVEENLPYIIPFFGGGLSVWGYMRLHYRKCRCGKRGCFCGGDENTI